MDGISLLFVTYLFGQALACSSSGWSQWINEHNVTNKKFPEEIGEANLPATGGDYENSTSLPTDFCAKGHGTLTQIQCVTAVGEKNYTTAQKYRGQGVVCNINTGFKCVNRMTTSKKCLDYKLRFYCECTNPSTAGGSRAGMGAQQGGNHGGGSGLRGPQATTPDPASGTRANTGNGSGPSGGGNGSGSGTGPGGKGGASTPATGHNGAAASKHSGVNGLVPASSATIGLFSASVMVLRMRGV